MIVAVTEVTLKSVWHLPLFLLLAGCNLLVSKLTKGNLHTSFRSGVLTHRTLSVWEDYNAMMGYVRSKPHMWAIKMNPRLAKSSYVCHYEAKKKPHWDEALKYLNDQGRSSL